MASQTGRSAHPDWSDIPRRAEQERLTEVLFKERIVLDHCLNARLAVGDGTIGAGVDETVGIEFFALVVLLGVEDFLVLVQELCHGMLKEGFIPALGVDDKRWLRGERHD